MGVYSNHAIRNAREDGRIVIEPFNEAHLQGSSYDVSLGMYYFQTELTVPHAPRMTEKHVRHLAEDVAHDVAFAMSPDGDYVRAHDPDTAKVVYNFYDPRAVAAYFGEVRTGRPFGEVCAGLGLNPARYPGIEDDEIVIPLAPRERILAHSHEFIGIHPPGTTELRARSSTGRNGITVAKCAGWGDPGYINRWTWEVENAQDAWVFLKVGMRVGQVVFHETGEVDGSYAKLTGNYQSGVKIDEVKAAWRPEMLLPRAKSERSGLPLVRGLSDGLV